MSTRKKFKLFCFPYAGGSSDIYYKWNEYLNPLIELRPIELAGRGKRFNDPLYSNLEDAVDDIFDIIKSEIVGHPYALFGHSMGAIFSYELAMKIKLMKMPDPIHAFFSGRGSPHIKDEKEKKYHLMDDEEFQKEILELGGTSPEFFKYKELTDLLLPMLKNDFKLADVSFCDRELKAFDFDISIFVGKQEDLSLEQIDGWKKHTKSRCKIYHFNGGHFFINDETSQITNIINNTLINKL